MSTDTLETVRLRALAIINAGHATAKDMGRALMPSHDAHQSHTRALEYLRGAVKPRGDMMLAFASWVTQHWNCRGKKKSELEAALESLKETK